MFGIDSSELLVIALVALVVIGPKDLPRVMRTIGNWVGKARGMAGHFRAGVDNMIRESELADMEKKWKAENERIMREHPAPLPGPAPAPAEEEKWPEPVMDELPPPANTLAAPAKAPARRPKAPPRGGGPPRRAAPPIPPPRPADKAR